MSQEIFFSTICELNSRVIVFVGITLKILEVVSLVQVHGFGDTGPVTYKKAAKFSHHCLNEVEISGLAAFLPWHSFRPCLIQLVQYLTEIAVS